jgi:tetratricopeptide (TPR) repeat protein
MASLLAAAEATPDRAGLLYSHGDYAGVIAALAGARKDPASLELLGKSYYMQADFKHAVEALEASAALDPQSSSIQTWLGRAYGRRAETSSPFSAYGYAKKSRQAFEKAVQLDPHNGEATGDLFDFYLQAPGMVGGGIEKARNLVPAITAIDPGYALVEQAKLDEAVKQYGSAEARLRRAIEIAPHQLGRVLDLAKFLAREGRYRESEESFSHAEKLAPNSPRVLFARAETYVNTKRNAAEARDLLHQYLALTNLTPDDPPRSEALKLLRKVEGA